MSDAADAALAVVTALSDASIPCAIGGALALNWWSEPRGTVDADINVFVSDSAFGRVLDALQAAGCTLDRSECMSRFHRGDVAIARLDGVRVDLFVPSIPFYEEAARTVQSAHIRGASVPVLSAEALAVFKLLFFRNKDLQDLRTLVRRRPGLDRAYIRARIAEMMGEDDERVVEWDAICRSDEANH